MIADVIPVNKVGPVWAVGTAANSGEWFPMFAGGTNATLCVLEMLQVAEYNVVE